MPMVAMIFPAAVFAFWDGPGYTAAAFGHQGRMPEVLGTWKWTCMVLRRRDLREQSDGISRKGFNGMVGELYMDVFCNVKDM